MSYLSICGGFNVGVAFLTDDVIDVAKAIGRDAREGFGTVWGKVAVGAPRAAEISWALDDHSCRSECLKR